MTLVESSRTLFDHPALDSFHPAVRTWFGQRFPEGPTPPQLEGWPAIAAGQDTLIAAPTGSGKTLTGFLVAIDRLYRAHDAGEPLQGRLRVVYVSPLRALAVDIKENLERPLREIAATARRLGFRPPDIDVGVRTGDTTSSGRAKLVRRPPNLLVTTPESLYLLLTAPRSRAVLGGVETVIVDEIHALARDKRGSHLALSLERLEHVTERRPVRIGLSATQKPLATVARLLVGNRRLPGTDDPACTIVDTGHRRRLDLALELPGAELEAVTSTEQLHACLDRIAELVDAHHTTLVFVNTRRQAERIAHLLGERLGDDHVASHHGSLSKDRRTRVESQLRAGELRALVATASLELGIDVGPVDLVCQVGSPRSIATFLQRIGRSGHNRSAVPKGRLFPLTRDELVECSALLAGVQRGALDAVHPPVAPLDILVQQIVAEAATERWDLDALYDLVRRAGPYHDLPRATFDTAVELAATGVPTGRGPKGDHLHLDRVNGVVAGRRGARLAAITSGGAIPELADYRVLADPDDTVVGTVNEEWAVESTVGDVFLLGTHTWRIRRIEAGVVRVVDADGAEPTVPFWQGEAPGRTRELSEEVGRLRAVVDGYLAAGDPDGARRWLSTHDGVGSDAAEQIVAYLAATRAVLGVVPTCDTLVIERFFDQTGGTQLVWHCPLGARLNRGLGLALRKRFCVTFDFELQAAASDDAIVLSLGPHHSFALESVPGFLRSATVGDVLHQAVLVPPSPLFVSRWRWNLNRSLTVLRWKGGRKNPPAIQRMESDDVMATVFPQAAACQENVSGPLEIPDHPLVTQTMHDTLTEAIDLAGLEALLADIEAGRVRVVVRDTVEPSPMSHEILLGKPYTFLDDGEAADRRTRTVPLRRQLPVALEEIGRPDRSAIERIELEVAPDPRSADELHDLLMARLLVGARPEWQAWFDELCRAGRARPWPDSAPDAAGVRWCATERLSLAAALHPAHAPPDVVADDPAEAARIALQGLLDCCGPRTVGELAAELGIGPPATASALAVLEAEGVAISGRFRHPDSETEWCARRVLARIHAASRARRRHEAPTAGPADLSRLLLRWQHVHPDTRLRGEDGVAAVVAQLQGWELPAGAWEADVLPARVSDYRPEMLDRLGHAGEVVWVRLAAPSRHDDGAGGSGGSSPGDDTVARRPRTTTRATRLALCTRADLPWLLAAARGRPEPAHDGGPDGSLATVADALRHSGARFLRELVTDTGLTHDEVEAAVWDGVARGLVTADSFAAVRALFDRRRPSGPTAPATSAAPTRTAPSTRRLRRGSAARPAGEGRWCLVPEPLVAAEPDDLAEAVAEQLLARWGVVVRELVVREPLALPWREILWALRRLEARGTVRGGRFVTGFSGEQYALPEAVDLLRHVQRHDRSGERIVVAAADPLNLTGVLVAGCRVPTGSARRIVHLDGLPVLDG
jgi:ATP-dependent Lhr-like helicase